MLDLLIYVCMYVDTSVYKYICVHTYVYPHICVALFLNCKDSKLWSHKEQIMLTSVSYHRYTTEGARECSFTF